MNDLLVARLFAQGGLVTAVEAHSCDYTNVSLHRLVASGALFRARSGCLSMASGSLGRARRRDTL